MLVPRPVYDLIAIVAYDDRSEAPIILDMRSVVWAVA
jgi:hypothetical protein